MLPEINQIKELQMKKFKREMLDVIDDILGETCTGVAGHFQPIQVYNIFITIQLIHKTILIAHQVYHHTILILVLTKKYKIQDTKYR